MRNSSLVDVGLRRKLPGLNYIPKLWIVHLCTVVEEHCVVGRSMIERTCGRGTRENAGISSESKVRIFTVESLRVPEEGSSSQGKSGPKVRPKGVADGHQVKIPELPTSDKDIV